MIRIHRPAAMFAAMFLLSTATAHEAPGQATYLGNEGVLVTHGDTKVLFDAFYADSHGQYTLVPDGIVEAMMAGDPPYDGIDAIFVSHVHGDHFTAKPAIRYLRKHPRVHLYGSHQTYEALAGELPADDPILERMTVVDMRPHDAARHFQLDGLDVDVVAIPHAGGESRAWVQNLSWRVTLDDATTVIHFGDAGTSKPDFDRHGEYLKAKRAHAAFPPYWFFDGGNGEAIMRSYMVADQVIGIHVPAAAIGDGDAWRERAGGDLFTDPGESRELTRQARQADRGKSSMPSNPAPEAASDQP